MGRSMLVEKTKGQLFQDIERMPNMDDKSAETGGALKLPEAVARKISFSRARYDTNLRSRSFSFFKPLRRFT